MTLGWLPSTSQGRMVGDDKSTSYVSGTARPIFTLAAAPSGTTFAQVMYATSSGMSFGAAVATAGGDKVIPSAVLAHVPIHTPIHAV